MRIYKDGIYKTIPSREFGIYQKAGFVKVSDDDLAKKEDVIIEEAVMEKPKPKNKNK